MDFQTMARKIEQGEYTSIEMFKVASHFLFLGELLMSLKKY